MYLQWYGLNKAPFQYGVDAEFFWRNAQLHTLFSVLKTDFEHHSRINLITGEPGCGKTCLVNTVVAALDPSVLVAMLSDSRLSVQEFYAITAHALGLSKTITDRQPFFAQLRELLRRRSARQHVLLVVDEAQELSPQLVAEIEAIITLHGPERERLSVCLVGQLDRAERLNPHLRSFFARHDMVLHHVAPFTTAETAGYIAHRLSVAGATRKIFQDEAIEVVQHHSRGYPMQINSLCDMALYSGSLLGAQTVDAALVHATAERLQYGVHDRANVQGAQREPMPAPAITSGSDLSVHCDQQKGGAIPDRERISALEVFAKEKSQAREAGRYNQQAPFLGRSVLLVGGLLVCLVLASVTYFYYARLLLFHGEVVSAGAGMEVADRVESGLPAVVSTVQYQSGQPAGERLRPFNLAQLARTAGTVLPQTDHRGAEQEGGRHASVDLQAQEQIDLLSESVVTQKVALPGENLVLPQLREQIQVHLEEAAGSLLQEDNFPGAEEPETPMAGPLYPQPEKQKNAVRREAATFPRSLALSRFLAGGSFGGDLQRTREVRDKQPAAAKKRVAHGARTVDKVEPDPADAINWLMNKKKQRQL